MSLALWAGLCVVVSTILARRPFVLCLASLAIWCLLPEIATPSINGYLPVLSDIHPAAVLMASVMVVQVCSGSPELRAALAHRAGWGTFAVFLVLAAVVMGLIGRGLSVVGATVNELIAPLSLFFLLGGCLLRRPERVLTVRRLVLVVAAAESLFAICQAVARRPLLWTVYYSRQPWFTPHYSRWMGTFDHPLILSLLLACAVFVLVDLRKWWLTLVLLLIFTGGLLATQSRTGIAVAALGSIYLLVRGRTSGAGKFILLLVGAAIVATAYRLGAGASVAARFTNDKGSSAVREQALTYYFHHWADYIWWGRGLGASFKVASDAGLPTSFESAVVMYSIDLGLIVALSYFCFMIAIVYRAVRVGAAPGSAAAAIAALIIVQTFSALSGATTVPPLLWALLALAGFSAPAPVSPERADPVLTPRSSLRVV